MVTDEELIELNKLVYGIDPNYNIENNEVPRPMVNMPIIVNDKKCYVLSLKNVEHGFQGMAVAPIVNGVLDTSQIVVVAAGTDSSDKCDLVQAGKAKSGIGSRQADIAINMLEI